MGICPSCAAFSIFAIRAAIVVCPYAVASCFSSATFSCALKVLFPNIFSAAVNWKRLVFAASDAPDSFKNSAVLKAVSFAAASVSAAKSCSCSVSASSFAASAWDTSSSAFATPIASSCFLMASAVFSFKWSSVSVPYK